MEKKKKGLAKASLWMGIFALIFGLAPFINGWFMLLIFAVWIFAFLALIFGIIALVKKQSVALPLIGILLSIVAVILPFIFKVQFTANVIEALGHSTSSWSQLLKESMALYL